MVQPIQDEPVETKDSGPTEKEKTPLEEVLSLHDTTSSVQEESRPMITFDVAESLAKMDITSEPSPPPVLAEVQDLVAVSSQLPDSISGETIQLQDELIRTQSPVQVHIVRYYRLR